MPQEKRLLAVACQANQATHVIHRERTWRQTQLDKRCGDRRRQR